MSCIDSKILTENVPQVTNQHTPIVLDDLNCRGSELRLGQCEHASTVEYCSHSNDAGAFCTNIIGKDAWISHLNQLKDEFAF